MVNVSRLLIILISLCSIEVMASELLFTSVDPLKGRLDTYSCESKKNNDFIEVVMAMNEIEPASFVLCNPSNKFQNIEYIGIVFDQPNTNLSKNIDVRYVKRWYQAGGAWVEHWRRKNKSAMLVPELLLKDPELIKVDVDKKHNYAKIKKNLKYQYENISNKKIVKKRVVPSTSDFFIEDALYLKSLNLPPNQQQQYWLTINAAGVKPGVYKGNILLKTVNEKVLIPLSITILPFNLEEAKIIHSIYYRGILDPDGWSSISSENKNRRQLLSEFKNMKSHGIKNPNVYQPIRPKKKWKGYSPAILEDTMNEYFKLRREAGFKNTSLYYLGVTTGRSQSDLAIKSVTKAYEKVKSIAEKYGFNTVYLYGSDEAKGNDLLAQKKVWGRVKSKGGKIFVAGSKGHVSVMGDETDLLIHRDAISKSELELMHQNGNLVFKYHDPKSGPENPEIFRYKRGLYLWQNDFDGAMDYAYQHSMGFIWNDFDYKRYRDLAFTYPTATGVIDTIAWEGYREGIDDLRYLATLEVMLRQLKEQADAPKLLIEKAQNYIDSLKSAGETGIEKYRNNVVIHIRNISTWLAENV